MKARFALLITFGLFCTICCSFLYGAAARADERTEDIAPGVLSVHLGVTEPSIPMEFSSDDDSLPEIKYEQNLAPKLGFGADYGVAGFNINFYSMEPDNLVEKYGKGKYFDFQFHLNFDHFLTDLYYQKFQGYYFNDGGDIIQRPDLKTQNIGGNLIYVFAPERISFAAAQTGMAYQKSSGGSWLALASFNDQRIDSDGTLAPAGYELQYERLGDLTHGKFRFATLGGGYGYSWVFADSWILHGAILTSFGPQWQNYDTEVMGSTSHVAFSYKINARFAVIYSGPRVYGGVSAIGDATTYQVDGKSLMLDSLLAVVFFGVRMDIGSF